MLELEIAPMGTLRPEELQGAKRLIHLHVPRSGGTSFKRVLDALYGGDCTNLLGPDEVRSGSPMGIFLRDVHNSYWTNRDGFQERWFSFYGEESLPDTPVYHGHTPISLYPPELLRDAVGVIWLRHPVRLVLSWYHWDNGRVELRNFDSPREFVEQRPRQNIMREMLASPPARFSIYYGISEYYAHDLAYLANAMGWPAMRMQHVNGQSMSVKYMDTLRDVGLCKRIAELNQADLSLYNLALRARMENERELLCGNS